MKRIFQILIIVSSIVCRAQVPQISSFVPSTSCPTSTVLIRGKNFTNASSVKFGGVNALSFTVLSSTKITAVVGSGNTGNISIITPGGTATSKDSFFVAQSKDIGYITDPLNNNIQLVDLTTGKMTGSVFSGNYPSGVGITPDKSKIYITNQSGDYISVMNAATNTIDATISISNGNGICFSPDGLKAYVTSYRSNISVINILTNSIENTIYAGTNPICPVISPDGSKLYVSDLGSSTIKVISTSANSIIASIPAGEFAYNICLNPAGTRLYSANSTNNNVTVINTTTNSVEATINVGNYPFGICSNYDGSKVYVSNRYSNSISVINAANNSVTKNISVGNNPIGLQISAETNALYVQNFEDKSITVINSSSDIVTGTINLLFKPGSSGNFILSQKGICAPLISSVSAAVTCPEAPVSIDGYNFLNTNSVRFGGVKAASIKINSPTKITATPATNSLGPVTIDTYYGSDTGTQQISVGADTFHSYSYVPNFDGHNISVIDNASKTVITTISLSMNANPWSIDISKNGYRAYVASQGTNEVSVINTLSNSIIANIALGNNVLDVCLSPDDTKLYVASTNSEIIVINTATNSVKGTIYTGAGSVIRGICVSPDGNTLYVTDEGDDLAVKVINLKTGLITATIKGLFYPDEICISPDGNTLYVSDDFINGIEFINTQNNLIIGRIITGTHPVGLCISPDGSKVYAANGYSDNNISVINTATNSVLTNIPLGTGASGLTVSRDGKELYALCYDANQVKVINAISNTISNTINVGQTPFGFGNVIANIPACLKASDLKSMGVTNTSATLSWTGTPCAYGYACEIRKKGTTSWTRYLTKSSFQTVAGLSPATTYQWRLLTACKVNPDTITSGYVQGLDFTTATVSLSYLARDNNQDVFTIRPNPTTGNATLILSNKDEKVKIKVMDADGKVVWQTGTRENNVVIPSQQFASGVYNVQIERESKIENIKFIKQ